MSDEQKRLIINASMIVVICACIVIIMFAASDVFIVIDCALNIKILPEVCTNGTITKFSLEIVGAISALYGATKVMERNNN
jgi:hypothetical protein